MLSTTEDCAKLCQEVQPEDLLHMISPKTLNPAQEEWLRWHERLNHLPHSKMRTLSKHGVLPKKLEKLHSPPLYLSCTFSVAMRRSWRHKDGHRSIKKETHVTPGSLGAVDQMISKKPGLIPQSSGCLTVSRT